MYYRRKRFTEFQSKVAYVCNTWRSFSLAVADPPIPHPVFAHVE